jgi:ABC-type transport system involved in Fe-S cluster assembly fused permease/ATPase subunit
MQIFKQIKGFSSVELLLLMVIVGMIGYVGFYVNHSKSTTAVILNSASNTVESPVKTTKLIVPIITSKTPLNFNTAELQNSLNNVNDLISKASASLTNVNNTANDQSGLTSNQIQ